MAINRTSITTKNVTETTEITLELVTTRPVDGATFTTPVTPNRLVGYFNNAIGGVELYIADATGYRYIRVR